jgi:superfamily II DNA helicase RecQ
LGSNAVKSQILRQLIEGVKQVFAVTSALGMGIDRATIRAVIYVGKIRGLRNYAQESGRAGRDGERSEAIMVVPLVKGELMNVDKDVS